MANKYFTVGKGIQAGGKKIVEGVKKAFSKKQPTITGMKPTTGQKEARYFKIGLASKKVNKQVSDLTKERNKRSKELFKDK